MAFNTCLGGQMTCTMGMTPAPFVPLPKTVMTSFVPAGHIMDHKPLVNIMPFGMCKSPANPAVAAATAAALGVLTPMPCIPNTPAPWVAGAPTVTLCNSPALNDSSKLMCIWAGTIQFTSPGQTTHQIP